MLSRCCFHHLVENLILYRKDIQHFYIEPILFSSNKIIWLAVVRKVEGKKNNLVPGVRNGKNNLVPGDSVSNYLVPNELRQK